MIRSSRHFLGFCALNVSTKLPKLFKRHIQKYVADMKFRHFQRLWRRPLRSPILPRRLSAPYYIKVILHDFPKLKPLLRSRLVTTSTTSRRTRRDVSRAHLITCLEAQRQHFNSTSIPFQALCTSLNTRGSKLQFVQHPALEVDGAELPAQPLLSDIISNGRVGSLPLAMPSILQSNHQMSPEPKSWVLVGVDLLNLNNLLLNPNKAFRWRPRKGNARTLPYA
jgi:hypothetical protein